MKKQLTLIALSSLLSIQTSFADDGPDGHAPIGVMGDHNHKQGEWMVSYRYGNMKMKGIRDGTETISVSDVHENFMMSPIEMNMDMHMFGAMYGVTDRLTIMAMLPYVRKKMTNINRMGMTSEVETDGIGDIKLSGLYTLYEKDHTKFLLKAGLSLPTGSIDKRGDTPMGANMPLPYPMQIGSGTYDLMPALTYTDKTGAWSWGGQANAVIRTGTNDNGYTLGDKFGFTAWGARKFADFVSGSIRVEGQTWKDIKGSFSMLNPMMSPAARTDLRGGDRIDLFAGLNFIVPDGSLKGNRFAIEFGLPIYQKLDGPQLETDYRLTAGWQLAF